MEMERYEHAITIPNAQPHHIPTRPMNIIGAEIPVVEHFNGSIHKTYTLPLVTPAELVIT